MDGEVGPTTGLFGLLLILVLDFILYGFGAALQALGEAEVEKQAQEEKDGKSQLLVVILEKVQGFVNTLQLIVSLNHVILGCICISLFHSLLAPKSVLLQFYGRYLEKVPLPVFDGAVCALLFVGMLYLVLTFGVLLPKKIAGRYPQKWAYLFVRPVVFLMKLFKPFTALVSGTVALLLRLFGIKDKGGEDDVTEEEIISIVQDGYEQGVLEETSAQMISNIIEFVDKECKDICTNRSQIVGIPADTTLREAIDLMLAEPYSRYPVYVENIDHIVGVLYLRDAYRLARNPELSNKQIRRIKGLLRAPFFIPQIKKIDELFREMQAKKIQMAIVVDEYGQTDGLVAMEDILEEIVGNIMDEYDVEGHEHIEKTGNDEYLMDGLTPLEELEKTFGISFEGEPFETLNGFMTSRLDRIPMPGDDFSVDYQGYNFKICGVENKVITNVRLKKLPVPAEQPAEE